MSNQLLMWGQKVRQGALSKLSAVITAKFEFLFTGADFGVITVTGQDFATPYIPATSAATFSLPDTSTYKDADTDYLWFTRLGVPRQVAVTELVSYDFNRTIVKYDNAAPYNIKWIGLLKTGETLTPTEIDQVSKYFELSIYWNEVLNAYGKVKGNRLQSKSIWKPEEAIIYDGNTAAWFDRSNPNGVVKDVNGVESIYWDLNVGSNLRGVEESAGVTIAYGIYEITATQTNHFFTGCAIGDIFPAIGGVVIDAVNKVKRVLGNHACQPIYSRRPINGVFDGVDDFMKTAAFTYNQPAKIYIVLSQLTWTMYDTFIDGFVDNSMGLKQYESATKIGFYAGSVGLVSGVVCPLNTFVILRLTDNGATSIIKLNNETAITGDSGINNPGGITLGANGSGVGGYANVVIDEAIFRKVVDGVNDDTTIYNYSNNKYAL